jgi:glycerol uptake facilitator protein
MIEIILGEVLGTMVFIMLAVSIGAAISLKGSPAKDSGWTFIGLGWAFALMMGIIIAAPLSGAHLNPAVSLGFLIVGKITTAEFFVYVGAQVVGAFLGALLAYVLYYDLYQDTEDGNAILGTFATSPTKKNTVLNIFSEMIGAFLLVFFILMWSTNDTLSPILIALALGSIAMSLGSLTGFAINPARDFGPRLLHQLVPFKNKVSSNWGYAFVPIVGPLLGGTLAGFLFLFVSNFI